MSFLVSAIPREEGRVLLKDSKEFRVGSFGRNSKTLNDLYRWSTGNVYDKRKGPYKEG